MTDIHTCSYYCHRPECIKGQRDQMREENAELRTRMAELEGLCKTYVEAIQVFIDGQEEGK